MAEASNSVSTKLQQIKDMCKFNVDGACFTLFCWDSCGVYTVSLWGYGLDNNEFFVYCGGLAVLLHELFSSAEVASQHRCSKLAVN